MGDFALQALERQFLHLWAPTDSTLKHTPYWLDTGAKVEGICQRARQHPVSCVGSENCVLYAVNRIFFTVEMQAGPSEVPLHCRVAGNARGGPQAMRSRVGNVVVAKCWFLDIKFGPNVKSSRKSMRSNLRNILSLLLHAAKGNHVMRLQFDDAVCWAFRE